MQPFSVGRESVINLCNYVAIWRWFDARQPEIFDRFGAGAEASGQQRQRREHCRKRTFIPPICRLVVGDIVAAQCQRREGALSGPTTLLVDPLGRREDRGGNAGRNGPCWRYPHYFNRDRRSFLVSRSWLVRTAAVNPWWNFRFVLSNAASMSHRR